MAYIECMYEHRVSDNLHRRKRKLLHWVVMGCGVLLGCMKAFPKGLQGRKTAEKQRDWSPRLLGIKTSFQ